MSVESDGGIDMEEEKQEQKDVKQGELQQEPVKVEKEVEKREKSLKNIKRICLIVLSILFVWLCMSAIKLRFDQLEEKMSSVNMRLNAIDNYDVANELRSVLEKQAAVLTSSDWDIKMIDKETKKVELTVSVVPKEYVEGMEVTFYADCSDGTKVSVKGEQNDSMKFVGKMEISLCDSMDMRVTLKKGDVTQIEEIGSDAVRDRFVMDFHADWLGACAYRDGVVNMDGQVKIELNGYEDEYGGEQNRNTMKKLEVVLYVADKEWKRLPVEMEQAEATSYYPEVKETIPLEAKEAGKGGEAFKMTIEGEDINGFHYHKIVMQTHFKENGECVDSWEYQPETEVY